MSTNLICTEGGQCWCFRCQKKYSQWKELVEAKHQKTKHLFASHSYSTGCIKLSSAVIYIISKLLSVQIFVKYTQALHKTKWQSKDAFTQGTIYVFFTADKILCLLKITEQMVMTSINANMSLYLSVSFISDGKENPAR